MSEWIATNGLAVLSVACAFLLFEVVRCWWWIMNLTETLHDQRNATGNWMREAERCQGRLKELEISDGWQSEAEFWRRLFTGEACETEGDDNE